MHELTGFKVILSAFCTSREWVFPVERFVEYEPSDRDWCERYGFGHAEERPACYRVGDTLLMHPQLWEAIKNQSRESTLAPLEPFALASARPVSANSL